LTSGQNFPQSRAAFELNWNHDELDQHQPHMSLPFDIEELSLTRRADVDRFLQVSYSIYAQDPHWVAPLLVDLKKVFSAANPFFAHAEMKLWVARRNGRDIGRVAGIIDRAYIKTQNDPAAFFGFLETINEPAVCHRLIDQVAKWAGQKQMSRLLGPMNPSSNDECGLLVDGFDASPFLMMPYNLRYYPELVESAGFTKAKDLFAYQIDLRQAPAKRLEEVSELFRRRQKNLTVRPVLKRTLEADLAKVKEIYNAAWEENWGFIPMTDPEIDFMAERLKPLLTEGLIWIAETPEEPVGFLLALADFNQALQPLRGRLATPRLLGFLPYLFGWKKPSQARVAILGVKRRYRKRGIEAVMFAESLKTSLKHGFLIYEASWILEDNIHVQRLVELFGGRHYKTYRLYARPINPADSAQGNRPSASPL
jgi:GNAT superfamily N-acetyltransferase